MIFSFITKRRKKTHETRSTSFSKIAKNRFQFDIDKCKFFVHEIKYLNLIITRKNIKINPKNSAIFDWSIFGN